MERLAELVRSNATHALGSASQGPRVVAAACAVLVLLTLLLRAAAAFAVSRRRLDGRVVLVTGAGSGIGRALALQCAGRGARVVAWDVSREGNDETLRLLAAAGAVGCVGHTVDVSSDASVRAGVASLQGGAADEAVAAPTGGGGGAHWPVDVLISCAGVVVGKDVHALSEGDVSRTLGVNLGGHFNLLRHVLPPMRGVEGGGVLPRGGTVVLISSLMGRIGGAKLADYCASKWGTGGLAESLRLELQRDGVGTPAWAGTPLLGSPLYSLLQSRAASPSPSSPPRVSVVVVCPYAATTGMFTGIFSEGVGEPAILRLLRPLLMPMLCAESIAASTLGAVLAGGDATLALPWHAGLGIALPRLLLPQRWGDVVVGASGGWDGMTGYTGRVGNGEPGPVASTPATTPRQVRSRRAGSVPVTRTRKSGV